MFDSLRNNGLIFRTVNPTGCYVQQLLSQTHQVHNLRTVVLAVKNELMQHG